MKFIIIRCFDKKDDPNCTGDPFKVVLFADGTRTLEGDYYHDQIDARIEGFVEGYSFATKEKIIPTENNRIFKNYTLPENFKP